MQLHSRKRVGLAGKAMVLSSYGPDVIDATPDHQDAEAAVIGVLGYCAKGAPVSASPRAGRWAISKAVAARQRQRVNVEQPLRQFLHFTLPRLPSSTNGAPPVVAGKQSADLTQGSLRETCVQRLNDPEKWAAKSRSYQPTLDTNGLGGGTVDEGFKASSASPAR